MSIGQAAVILDAEQLLKLLEQLEATVGLTTRRVQLCKPIADVVVGVKVVKSGFELTKDGLAIRDQQLQEFLVLFHVVWHRARHVESGRSRALLKFVDVRLAQEVRVAYQFLAVEGCQHPVVQGFLVLRQLAQHCAQLQVVLAEITQFEQLRADIELLHLVLR